MNSLVVLLVVQFGCRLFNQPLWSALGSTIFLSLFAYIAYRWGGWTSIANSALWLKGRPLQAWLILGGTFGVLGLMIYNGRFDLPSMGAEVISALIFFYAFCSVGDRLQNWIRLRK